MSDLGLSTIAQLLFLTERSINFARIVAELETVLARLQPRNVHLAWDCDDFVCFDIPGTRIQLSWSEVERRGYRGCLSIAVGPGERASRGYHEDMCSRLVDRIQSRFDPVAVLWCQAEGAIGSEVIDDLLFALPHLGSPLPDIESLLPTLTLHEARLAAGHAAPKPTLPHPAAQPAAPKQTQSRPRRLRPVPPHAANDHPHLPPLCNRELDTVRQALYPAEEPSHPYSTQMRLAVHCLNATLILVWTPMGAALMTYSLLKGEDMRLSSRVMVVTGTFLVLAQTPVGMTVAAMAKSLV